MDELREMIVEGNTRFAFELYRRCSRADENILFSPFSISQALAMVWAGSAGESAAQIRRVLGLSGDKREVYAAFSALGARLAALSESARALEQAEGHRALELELANSLWGQLGYEFRVEFLETIGRYFSADISEVDFEGAPASARERINGWVAQKTKGRITDLVPPGGIASLTRLILVNAVYFKADWASKFDSASTRDEPFYLADGGQVQARMMSQSGRFRYAEREDYQALELLYGQGEASILLLLPADLARFERDFSASTLQRVDEELEDREVYMTLPKFEFSQSMMLGEELRGLGLSQLFGPGADLSLMSEREDIFIAQALHEAFIAVDEEGTEAAAATAIMAMGAAAPQNPVRFRADRPFVFLIREAQTRSVLFMGRLDNPSALP